MSYFGVCKKGTRTLLGGIYDKRQDAENYIKAVGWQEIAEVVESQSDELVAVKGTQGE